MVGGVVGVYSGKEFTNVEIRFDMIGKWLGNTHKNSFLKVNSLCLIDPHLTEDQESDHQKDPNIQTKSDLI